MGSTSSKWWNETKETYANIMDKHDEETNGGDKPGPELGTPLGHEHFLKKTSAYLAEDPRSPGHKRTPIQIQVQKQVNGNLDQTCVNEYNNTTKTDTTPGGIKKFIARKQVIRTFDGENDKENNETP